MPPIKEQNFLYYYSYYQLKSMIKGDTIQFEYEGLSRKFAVVTIGDDFLDLKNEIDQLYKITQRKKNPRIGGLNGPRNT